MNLYVTGRHKLGNLIYPHLPRYMAVTSQLEQLQLLLSQAIHDVDEMHVANLRLQEKFDELGSENEIRRIEIEQQRQENEHLQRESEKIQIDSESVRIASESLRIQSERLRIEYGNLQDKANQYPVQHRRFEHFDIKTTSANATLIRRYSLIERIQSAYRANFDSPVGSTDSIWLGIFANRKEPVHALLVDGEADEIAANLENPLSNTLFHGFDSISSLDTDVSKGDELLWRSQWTYDNLLRLSEAVGARKLENPEAPPIASRPSAEKVLQELDQAFGFKVTFPNPFQAEPGLDTSRGVATYRAVQALYQAWRISRIVGTGARILEIGAGTGRAAFYARKFGLMDYTIVDIPMTNVAQAYFLGSTIGEDAISLCNENRVFDQIRILSPDFFMSTNEHFDLVVNIDSMTEMSRSTAIDYLRLIPKRTSKFLSINHEANAFSVNDIARELGRFANSREAHWMRRGYVEEIYTYS